MSGRALRLQPADNVATALDDLPAGEAVSVGEHSLILPEPIPLCHKLALVPIPAGGPVIKYGQCIGRATQHIAAGGHVHVHNMQSARGR